LAVLDETVEIYFIFSSQKMLLKISLFLVASSKLQKIILIFGD
jgi:hypothetical protein